MATRVEKPYICALRIELFDNSQRAAVETVRIAMDKLVEQGVISQWEFDEWGAVVAHPGTRGSKHYVPQLPGRSVVQS